MLTGVLALLAGACNEPPAVNPWRDDSIPESAWYSHSGESVLAANARPAIRHRDIPPSTAPLADGSVPHYPLWYEDPFEDQGDGNHEFAWTWQDYFAMPYGEGRYIVNTLGMPVSAVLQPPGSSMVSDGVVEPRGISAHDAKMGCSPNPSATRADFGIEEESGPLPEITTSAPAP